MTDFEKPFPATPDVSGVSADCVGETQANPGNGLVCGGGADPFMRDRFAVMWDDYTDANWLLVKDPTLFLEQCEDAGLAECVPVDADALEDAFAWERGIEPGGMMWRLTALGHERYAKAKGAS